MSQFVPSMISAAVIVPPLQDFYFTPHRFSALGANIVYRILQRFFPSSQLYNFPLLRKKNLSAPFPEELSYIKAHIMEDEIGKISFFKNYKHFGPSVTDCAKTITDAKIDLCLISCFAYCYAHTAVELADQIKLNNKNCVIIIGGAAVSACSKFFLKFQSIDYVVTGEAEVSLTPLLAFLVKGTVPLQTIPNIGWKENGNQIFSKIKLFTQSSEIEPLVTKTYENNESIFLSTTISRGCTFTCQFCSNRISQGTTFRTPDPEKIEQTLIAATHGLESTGKKIILNFEDDNVLLDYDYLKDVICRCKKNYPSMQFSFENGIDYRLLAPEMCLELINLGVRQFNFSIGTTDKSISGTENRFQDFSNLDVLYQIIKEKSIPVITYFICGFPDDTHDTIIRNLDYLMNRPTLSGISLFYSVPGLKYYHNDTVNKHLFSPCLFAGTSAFPWNDSLSTTTLITAFRLSRFINLIKSEDKNDQEKQLIEQIISEKKLFTIVKLSKSNSVIKEVRMQDYTLVKSFVERIL